MTYGRGPGVPAQSAARSTVPDAGRGDDRRPARALDRPGAHGFFGGDHHIHAAGCAHYTAPTQGVEPEDMFLQVKGEGLNVGCILTWGPCYDYQRRFFEPHPRRR